MGEPENRVFIIGPFVIRRARSREVAGGIACTYSGTGGGKGRRVEEAINFTARFIMEPPSIIAAGYAHAARTPRGAAIINSEKLLIAIMSSFTESAAAVREQIRWNFADDVFARRVLNYVRFA